MGVVDIKTATVAFSATQRCCRPSHVNRPYDEIKKHGIIRDFWGVFSHLNEALRYDKAELGEAAFPLRRVREEFKLHMETTLRNSIPRFIALVLSRLSFDNIGSKALR